MLEPGHGQVKRHFRDVASSVCGRILGRRKLEQGWPEWGAAHRPSQASPVA